MTKTETKEAKTKLKWRGCKRCGKCCRRLSGSFWAKELVEDARYFESYGRGGNGAKNEVRATELLEIAKVRITNGPAHLTQCEMLHFYRDGKAYCLIELMYGKRAKPLVCRRYSSPNPNRCAGVVEVSND